MRCFNHHHHLTMTTARKQQPTMSPQLLTLAARGACTAQASTTCGAPPATWSVRDLQRPSPAEGL